MGHPVIWSAHTLYVDEDTGQSITKHEAETNYYHLTTDKHAIFTNNNKTRGHIEYTKRYRRKPKQGELFPNTPRTN